MHVDVASFKRIINILIAMFLQRFSSNFHFLIGISKQSHKKKTLQKKTYCRNESFKFTLETLCKVSERVYVLCTEKTKVSSQAWVWD